MLRLANLPSCALDRISRYEARAKPGRFWSRSMQWIAANHRTEGAEPVSQAINNKETTKKNNDSRTQQQVRFAQRALGCRNTGGRDSMASRVHHAVHANQQEPRRVVYPWPKTNAVRVGARDFSAHGRSAASEVRHVRLGVSLLSRCATSRAPGIAALYSTAFRGKTTHDHR